MAQLRRDLDLAQEPLGFDRLGEVALDDLQCNFAIVLSVVGKVDDRISPTAKLALDRVAVGEGG